MRGGTPFSPPRGVTWGDCLGTFLAAGAAELGIALSPQQLQLLERHLSLIAAWSGRVRLTGARTPAAAVEVLVLRTLPVLRYLPAEGVMIDLGSGAGVPGITMAVVRPRAHMVLVEPSQKRAGFLEIVLRELRLANAEVRSERAEVLGRDPRHRGRYDAVIARALAPVRVLAEYALPLLRLDGVAVFPKGRAAAAEVQAAAAGLRILGGAAEVYPAVSPRASPVVVVRKVAPTPETYPRRAGTLARRPL